MVTFKLNYNNFCWCAANLNIQKRHYHLAIWQFGDNHTEDFWRGYDGN